MGRIIAIIGITTFVVGIVLLVLGARVSKRDESTGNLLIMIGCLVYGIFGIDFVVALGYMFYAFFVFLDKVVC